MPFRMGGFWRKTFLLEWWKLCIKLACIKRVKKLCYQFPSPHALKFKMFHWMISSHKKYNRQKNNSHYMHWRDLNHVFVSRKTLKEWHARERTHAKDMTNKYLLTISTHISFPNFSMKFATCFHLRHVCLRLPYMSAKSCQEKLRTSLKCVLSFEHIHVWKIIKKSHKPIR